MCSASQPPLARCDDADAGHRSSHPSFVPCRTEDVSCHSGTGEPGRKRRIETEKDAENFYSNVEMERRQAGRQPPLGIVRQLCLEAAELRFLDSQRGEMISRCPECRTAAPVLGVIHFQLLLCLAMDNINTGDRCARDLIG